MGLHHNMSGGDGIGVFAVFGSPMDFHADGSSIVDADETLQPSQVTSVFKAFTAG